MSAFYAGVYATPFHPRTAERNVQNVWVERGGFTLPRHFGNFEREAIAARYSVALADFSGFGRLRVHGAGASRLLSSACKTDLGFLAAGAARDVHWKSDGGGIRGFGTVARYGEEIFVLESADIDFAWFDRVAPRFRAVVRDERGEKGVLLLVGSLASALLDSAGLGEAAKLAPQNHGLYEWRGVPLIVSRRASHGGFELSCAADDSLYVFDRIMAAGARYGLTLIGQDALEQLYIEAGVPLPGLDFVPARDARATTPSGASLGLQDAGADQPLLMGVEWNGAPAAPSASLYRDGRKVGRILRSAYSPTLRRVVALVQLEAASSVPGNELLIPCVEQADGTPVRARVSPLPFLRIA